MTLRRTLALAVALVALLSTGTVAAADTAADGRQPLPGALQLMIVADYQIADTTTLTCDPAGGNHPNAGAACAELARVSGNLDRLRPDGQVLCTMEFRPVTATAHGAWRGRLTTWQRTFSNPCLLYASTGSVFQF